MNEIASISAAQLAANSWGEARPRTCPPQTVIRAAKCAKPHIKLELGLASEPQQPENSPHDTRASP
jgi:hypothetical protein